MVRLEHKEKIKEPEPLLKEEENKGYMATQKLSKKWIKLTLIVTNIAHQPHKVNIEASLIDSVT